MDPIDTEATRAGQLTALLADAPKPDDHDGVRDYLHSLAALGCDPLLIYPNSKKPFDGRTVRQRNADDKVAKQAAREAGRPRWQKVESPAGVYLATADAAVLDRYLTQYAKAFGSAVAINVAVAVGRSGLVVVDCDTADQVAAFLADMGWSEETVPTVRTPGAQTSDGKWIHSGGGHFWFTLPEGVELPAGVAEYKDHEGGYSVFWGPGRYVLMPPSVRAEGAYTVPEGGAVHELPEGLLERIIERAPAARRVADRSVFGGESTLIDEWSRAVDWAEILGPLGWTPTGQVDRCGCETWTAPGEHASPKSATGHEPGCGCEHYDTDNPPLHIWTDTPGLPFAQDGRRTLSKLQAVALIDFDNDMGAAMDARGLVDDPVTLNAEQGDADTEVGENLPESFWATQDVLTHIRQAAHYGVNSGDAVLGAVLTRLAATLDPSITVDTGVKQPMPLSMFVGLVGSAGTGKSSAYAAAGRLLEFDYPKLMTAGLVASAHERPLELPVGSGPGLAEAFMGAVIDPENPKVKPIRKQVSHKLLLYSDEGAGLVAGILDAKRGQDIGPALRTAWTGAVLGQANASAERKRQVRDYAVGLCVGFQLEALANLSTPEQLEYGTPQRFLYVSATDPAIPDIAPADPGPLSVTLPSAPLRYSDELRARARREALARTRGQSDEAVAADPMNAHRPAMVARLAALLVVLCEPGRNVIETRDVELAETLLGTSGRLHDKAVSYRRERETAETERRTAQRISEEVAKAVAVDGRDAALARMSERILRYVDVAGGAAVWNGRDGLRKSKFKNDERQLADAARDRLVADGTLVVDGDRIARP